MKYKVVELDFSVSFKDDKPVETILDLGSWAVEKIIREKDGHVFICLLKQSSRGANK